MMTTTGRPVFGVSIDDVIAGCAYVAPRLECDGRIVLIGVPQGFPTSGRLNLSDLKLPAEKPE